MSKLIRTLTPEVRVIDAARGIADYVASDESLDSYAEVIKASGWKFSRFAKNAPFVDSHDYYCIEKLLGKVTDFRVEGKQLIERVQWAVEVPENTLAQLGWKMTQGGYLKAVSVGFVPVKAVSKWDSDNKPFAEACKDLGMTTEAAMQVRCIYLEQEQLELSACIIGANPNALAKAHKDGCVVDGDLAACGFRDEDMNFLHDCAADYEATDDPIARNAIRSVYHSFARLIGRQTLSTQPNPKNATPAHGRAAAEEAQQRDRARFVAELKSITQ